MGKKKKKNHIKKEELWNLDGTFCEFIIPRLKKFKNTTHSYPGTLNSYDEWQEILSKMIKGFEAAYAIEEDNWWMDNPKYDFIDTKFFKTTEEQNKIRENHIKHELKLQNDAEVGLKLFAEYFMNLWD